MKNCNSWVYIWGSRLWGGLCFDLGNCGFDTMIMFWKADTLSRSLSGIHLCGFDLLGWKMDSCRYTVDHENLIKNRSICFFSVNKQANTLLSLTFFTKHSDIG